MPVREPWERLGVTLPIRLINALDRLPLTKSAAIELCVEYTLRTDFMELMIGEIGERDDDLMQRAKDRLSKSKLKNLFDGKLPPPVEADEEEDVFATLD